MKELVCKYCGRTFKVKDSRANAVFCSRECYRKSRCGYEQVTCIECGCSFEAKRSQKRKFCSKKCYQSYYDKKGYYWNKKDRVRVICENCGKEEFVTKSRAKRYRYCSKKCEAIARTKPKEKLKLVDKVCPICKSHFSVKPSHAERRICCSKKCAYEYKREQSRGDKNPNYRGYIIEDGVRRKSYERYKDAHQRIVRDFLGITIKHPYHIHHKDANPSNNDLSNLVVLPAHVHMLIHRWFGNILLNAVSHGRINREEFFSLCTQEQSELYRNIIDLDITSQVVVKQGELLENPEVDNQQPSIYRNIYEGSTTNSRDLADNAEVSNADTSALPFVSESEDIV